MAQFMELKPNNPTIKQSEKKTKKLGMSSCTVQGYRNDINMLSLYRFQPNIQKRRQNSEHDLKKPQKIEVAKPDSTVNHTTNKKTN